jgi:hypothetical protein
MVTAVALVNMAQQGWRATEVELQQRVLDLDSQLAAISLEERIAESPQDGDNTQSC